MSAQLVESNGTSLQDISPAGTVATSANRSRRRIAYHAVVRHIIDTVGGLWELFLLGWKTRFRLRSAYWKWRFETAFGTDPAKMPSRRERIHAVLDYGRWVYRIKRGR